MDDFIERTLASLVATPSVNPMGRPVEGPEYYEYRVTDYLEGLFRELGVAWQRQPVAPRRDNIYARIEGRGESGAKHLLLFEAHQDTVPVEGMTIPPWQPEVKQGRLFGRGACDVKGGMTAMLAAFHRLALGNPSSCPTLVLACTVNEEHGYTGALAMCEAWRDKDFILPRPPDAAIVAEPTDLSIVVAHKGAVRWRCHALGTAAHSSSPDQGENAVYRMARILLALEDYQRRLASQQSRHPLCGEGTLSVGTITGGLSVNTVPDRCTIEIDRRFLPGETPEQAREDVLKYLESREEIDFPMEHDAPFLVGHGLADALNGDLAGLLARVAESTPARGQRVGVPYGTDAAVISRAGIPAVVFGPGSIAQAHTADEWIELEEVRRASEILYEFALRYGA